MELKAAALHPGSSFCWKLGSLWLPGPISSPFTARYLSLQVRSLLPSVPKLSFSSGNSGSCQTGGARWWSQICQYCFFWTQEKFKKQKMFLLFSTIISFSHEMKCLISSLVLLGISISKPRLSKLQPNQESTQHCSLGQLLLSIMTHIFA